MLSCSGNETQMSGKLPCDRLKDLRTRAGYSQADMGRMLGFSSPSAYPKYESPEGRGEKAIPERLCKQLIPLLVGRGFPPITEDEVISLNHSGFSSRPLSKPSGGYPVGGLHFSFATQSSEKLLPVRVQAGKGVFVEDDFRTTDYGPSQVAAMPDSVVPFEAQFCATPRDNHAEKFGYPVGTTLHCCWPELFGPGGPPSGKRVAIWVQRAKTGLGEIIITSFRRATSEHEWVAEDADGNEVAGKPVAVVMQSLRKE